MVRPGAAGRVHPIVRHGDPVLHRPCEPVTDFGPALTELVEDMYASMHAADGAGLAANQIGVGLRVFVYDCPDATGERRVGEVVNPSPVRTSSLVAPLVGPEGCLSVPGAEAELARAGLATVTGVDRHGLPVSVSGTGTLARCLQHEVDHLDGVLYVDRLAPEHRDAVLAAARRAAPPPPSSTPPALQEPAPPPPAPPPSSR